LFGSRARDAQGRARRREAAEARAEPAAARSPRLTISIAIELAGEAPGIEMFYESVRYRQTADVAN
jgi:hypothetical protein